MAKSVKTASKNPVGRKKGTRFNRTVYTRLEEDILSRINNYIESQSGHVFAKITRSTVVRGAIITFLEKVGF